MTRARTTWSCGCTPRSFTPRCSSTSATSDRSRSPSSASYYEEQKLLGEQFGVPREHQPATYAEFNDYFDDMLASERIAPTDALRDVVDAVMKPDLPVRGPPA